MRQEIIVREARPEDDARIGELLVKAFVDTYAQKMPEVVVTEERKHELRNVAEKRQNATVLVAEMEGLVIGTVSIVKPGAKCTEAWLDNAADLRHLASDISVHGRGYASALLDRAEEIAFEEWKASAICLHVRRGASGVARMY